MLLAKFFVVSFGMKHELHSRSATILLNPVMGHLRLAYTAPTILKAIRGAARFDFNLHSLHSDLAVGLEYSLDGSSANVAIGRAGLALLFSLEVSRQCKLLIGLCTGAFSPPRDCTTECLPLTYVTLPSNSFLRTRRAPQLGLQLSFLN